MASQGVGGMFVLFPVFRIRICLIKIRIQHFKLNTDPDPDSVRIEGFDNQKCKKIYS